MLSLVANNMNSLGYTRIPWDQVTSENRPDVALVLWAIGTNNWQAWVGWWPGWGWGTFTILGIFGVFFKFLLTLMVLGFFMKMLGFGRYHRWYRGHGRRWDEGATEKQPEDVEPDIRHA